MGIMIHTNSSEEQTFLEEVLRKMKISFETTTFDKNISKAELESIKRGLEQAEKGEFLESSDIHEKARLLCSK